MARKIVPVTTISHYGLTPLSTPTVSTVLNGWLIPNDGATFLYLDNTAAATVANFSVTYATGADVNLTVGPRVYTVPAGIPDFTGFFPIRNYGSQLLISCDIATPGIAAYSFSYSGQQDSFQ